MRASQCQSGLMELSLGMHLCDAVPVLLSTKQHSSHVKDRFAEAAVCASASSSKLPLTELEAQLSCSVGGWTMGTRPTLEVTHLRRAATGNSVPLPRAVLRLVLSLVVPRLLTRLLLTMLPPELGTYLLNAEQTVYIAGAATDHWGLLYSWSAHAPAVKRCTNTLATLLLPLLHIVQRRSCCTCHARGLCWLPVGHCILGTWADQREFEPLLGCLNAGVHGWQVRCQWWALH